MNPASQDPIDILSAGAVKTLLAAAGKVFLEKTGHASRLTFATAPTIAGRIENGERPHILVAPPSVLETVTARLPLVGKRISLGRVGVAMACRDDAAAPDISSADAFIGAVRAAPSVVINGASTGLYIEKLLARLGIAGEIEDKLVRLPTGGAVMNHLANGGPLDIGFGAVTEIEVHRGQGVRVAALLPDAIQNYTSYDAAALTGPQAHPAADAYIAFLGSPACDVCFVEGGVMRAVS